MPFWADFYKFFSYAFKPDPLSRKRAEKTLDGVGVTQPDAIPDIRADNWWGGGNRGQIRLRDSNDFIDLSSVTNRQSRYKEYERLRGVAEIEAALDILSDESCVSGDTPVITPFGPIPIEKLAKTKKPDEKFLVYCWSFQANDYTLGWAYHPRKVKHAATVEVYLDNGITLKLTDDHRVLKRNGEWVHAGSLKSGDELMPFHRVRANHGLNEIKTNQFPRIFTFADGWKHERQFTDEWKLGQKANYDPRLKQALKCLTEGLQLEQTKKMMGVDWKTIEGVLRRGGFTYKEVKSLNARHPDRRRVIGVSKGKDMDVYDLSVEVHENFATDSCILHNCQKGDNGHTFEIKCKNESVKKELDFLFHRILGVDRKLWNWAKNLYCMGDWFGEIVIDPENPKMGVLKINPLPADSIYRIETTKGKLLEFQQSKEGPDYQSLARVDVTQASDAEIAQATAIRFAPEQIVHMRIGDDRKTFYPYGVSIIEPARGPAHQLRLMEDAMVVYRLCIRGYDKIRTDDSWKYMKDIKEGDRVFTLSRDGNLTKSKVIKHVCNGVKPVFRVRTDHTEITGTETHPVLVYDKLDGLHKYVDIKDLVVKRHQVLNTTRESDINTQINRVYTEPYARLTKEQKKKYSEKDYEDKTALIREVLDELGLEFNTKNKNMVWGFLVSKDSVARPLKVAQTICDKFGLNKSKLKVHNRGERNPERINVPDYVDEDFARLFGYLIGDGCLNYNGRMAKLLVSVGEHEDINQRYRVLLEKYFGHAEFRQDKRLREGLGEYSVSSSTVCDILRNLGYEGKAKTKRVPKWVFTAPKSIRIAFVKGLCDADGDKRDYDNEHWTSTLTLCNKEFVEDVKELWSSCGLCSGVVANVQFHERKINGKLCPATEGWRLRLIDKPLPKQDDVISIEYIGEEPVYDITVDHEEHNFVCNGIIVHNTRAPERRVFYIDVGSLPPNKAEAFIERLKDQLRKKKMYTNRSGQPSGAGSVEERWHAPAADEDFWLPIRPNGNTRIETLPGAQNLGEVDDALYFRNKLLIALHMPRNYMNSEDAQLTNKTLSAQNVPFARYVERLQMGLADGLLAIAERHLKLRGYPEEMWDDLDIGMTPPSAWREASLMEIIQARFTNAGTAVQAGFMSKYDALVEIMKYQPDVAREMASRAKMQAIEDMKIQVMGQNPDLLGVGQPGPGGQEMGGEAGGPNPMLGGEAPPGGAPGGAPPGGPPPGGGAPPGGPPPGGDQKDEPAQQPVGQQSPPGGKGDASMPGGPAGGQPKAEGKPLPDPSDEDIKKYDLEIRDFSKEKDEEEIDPIELGGD